MKLFHIISYWRKMKRYSISEFRNIHQTEIYLRRNLFGYIATLYHKYVLYYVLFHHTSCKNKHIFVSWYILIILIIWDTKQKWRSLVLFVFSFTQNKYFECFKSILILFVFNLILHLFSIVLILPELLCFWTTEHDEGWTCRDTFIKPDIYIWNGFIMRYKKSYWNVQL